MDGAGANIDSSGSTHEGDEDMMNVLDIDKLIVLVENNPPIYNLSLKEHHNQDILSKIWNEIGKELNVPGRICKAKWVNLRNGYNRCLREMKKTPSGSGQKKKKWHLFDAMQFLQPWAGSTRKKTGNLDSDIARSTPVTQRRLLETHEEVSIQELLPPEEDDEISAGRDNEGFVPKKKKQKTAAEIVVAPMVDFPKAATEKKKQDDGKQENPMLTFFKSLIPDTEALTNENKRKFKLQVMTTLNNIIDEQYKKERFYKSNVLYPIPRSETSHSADSVYNASGNFPIEIPSESRFSGTPSSAHWDISLSFSYPESFSQQYESASKT